MLTMISLSFGSCGLNSQLQTTEFLIDVPFDDTSNAVIVEASVNGQGPYQFILDSGAPTLFTQSLIEELGLANEGAASINDVNRLQQSTSLVRADSLVIGNLVLNDVDAASLNNQELACLANGGILGANVLKHGAWEFDFIHKRIRGSNIVSRIIDSQQNLEWLPFTTKFGKNSPWINVVINEKSFSFLVDTGSTRELAMNSATEREIFGALDSTSVHGEGYSSIGLAGRTLEASKRVRIPSLQLGSTSYSQATAQVKTENTNRLGTLFFQGQRLIIDWDKKQLAIKGLAKSTPEPLNEYGLTLLGDAEGVFVSYVWAGSEASELGLKPGDRVLEINGNPVSAASPCYAAPQLNEITGTLILTLLTNGLEHQVSLDRQIVLGLD
ncbi:MAG: PDZ domain-containing protein [Gammaproteobacteria bacterium]|nr:PDZ domain-containing protein [Gammaproteobacteria bacterium]MBT3860501.1 PDZ domain-containing protein [Gammaproteobacteria bacterium]MBT3988650.1 PDZ domain-containing protein [Gammaproteobacteria bacterium]MBT4254896.1 PDZ domain-containing protein [Gammaproteobacteria bacterium]MBT4580605.1 PDZ domain-containing protein [Gammaproteobacteria bacterium]